MSTTSQVDALAARMAAEINTLRQEMSQIGGASRQYYLPLNGRFRGDSLEVQGHSSSYGPTYGNHTTDLGNYPLNFTSQPNNKAQGYGMPFKARLDRISFWWWVNNVEFVHRILIWKQTRFEGLSSESPTLIYETPEITPAGTNPYWIDWTTELGSAVIEQNECLAIAVARPGSGSTRYFYYTGTAELTEVA